MSKWDVPAIVISPLTSAVRMGITRWIGESLMFFARDAFAT